MAEPTPTPAASTPASPQTGAVAEPEPERPAPEVEVEVDREENDSSWGDDEASRASTSLKSVTSTYEWKHGRRYHGYQSGSYNFPNDEEEQDRLDMIHHVFFRLMNDRLYLAPIKTEGLKVLDIGTGTGIWPIQFGDEHPEAEVIVGNDLSPIQPQWVPPNVKFIIDDVELDWAEPEQYDYIHCRYMAGSIKDWPRLVNQIYENLKPGGWVEFQESANTLYSEDGSLKPDNAMVQMMDGLMEACEKIGRTMDPAPSFKRWTEQAGFQKVGEQRFKLPIGSWPKDARLKEVGTLMGVNFLEGVEAFTAALFKDVLGWSPEEVTVLNAGVRAAVWKRDVHPIFDFVVVTGLKPL
ncbi:S-adenosyl-L-methionine-dependent methyltransferase [Colletotrichum phormii]|uniref:S-adenosyl-L-methionine-dependent methyltransferase n=1 Tax=Colletotrichum phormii TaxID=359342 RepID=A0AAI9ZL07_9PEZI|nr:S-adenosyl-L-methionine-dependent methyltransferase [Colletotrichum phormii]KAK1625221.1 S-adenosyl-L-methionine-dependent methyltransferase [Colletotrichum phormii]